MKKKYWLLGILCAAALLLCGCGMQTSYANAGKYTAGNAQISDPVENLDIHWIDGKVNIAYHAENTVKLEESSRGQLKKDEQLHWWLDGNTLRVYYAASGHRMLTSLNKTLTVYLPENTVLQSAEIAAVSGDILAQPLHAEQIKLESTSGNVSAYSGASSIKIKTTSGDVSITAASNQVTVNSTSGGVTAVIEHADEVSIHTTSGRVLVKNQEAREITAGSTSGLVRVENRTMPQKVSISNTSGGAELAVPRDAGLTADLSTTSGRISVTVPAQQNGKRYVLGDGGAQVKINTTSGNVSISEYQE